MDLMGSSVITVTSHQVSTSLDGEAVVLELSKGIYYGLPAVGATVWEMIQQPISVDDLVRDITEEYDVSEERCHEDLVALLGEMIDRGLARTVDDSIP